MQFLLIGINSKYIHSNPAIYSLCSYVKEYREYVALAEYTINHDKQAILADICGRKPTVIGFSCYIWNWELVQELILAFHQVMPDVPIWLGGPEVSHDAEEVLRRYHAVKGIMVGEGEEVFAELLKYYLSESKAMAANAGRTHLEEIAGLAFREDGKIVRAATRPCLDMNAIVFPYQELKAFTNRIIYYESGRGCPFRCSYCLSAIDKQVRFKGMDKVEEELGFFLAQKVKQVKFIDRTFNCNKQHAVQIWKFISKHDNGITNFHFEIAADLLDGPQLAILNAMRPGLVQLEIGVQSTNEQTLQEINRITDIRRLKEIVGQLTGGRNIHIHLDLIAGLPYEGYDSFRQSFNEVYDMQPEQLQLGFLKVLKGSPLQAKVLEYGIRHWDKPPYEVLYTKWLTYDEVVRLKKIEAMVDIFYNSNQFMHTLKVLRQQFLSPFAMFEALSRFYEEKGYLIQHPARAYRYEVLLEFAGVYDKEQLDMYKELLVYDMYLRENAKSRPGYAAGLTDFKDRIYDFYQAEERSRDLLAHYRQYNARQMMRMTHVDMFHYPVWNMKEHLSAGRNTVQLDKPVFLLFDYERRDALTGNAAVYFPRIGDGGVPE